MTKQNNNHSKILFRFHSEIFDKPMVETMWATPVDQGRGLYKIDNIPFYALHVASGDVVFAEYDDAEQILVFRGVVTYSGNSTIQVVLIDKSKDINAIRDLFKTSGCHTEKLNEGYFAMEIPASVDYKPIKRMLEELKSRAIIAYAEPCLAEGHRY